MAATVAVAVLALSGTALGLVLWPHDPEGPPHTRGTSPAPARGHWRHRGAAEDAVRPGALRLAGWALAALPR